MEQSQGAVVDSELPVSPVVSSAGRSTAELEACDESDAVEMGIKNAK